MSNIRNINNIRFLRIALTVGLMIIIISIGGLIISNYEKIGVKNKDKAIIDSLTIELVKYKLADSLNKEFRKVAFYINRDSISIDSRGYFYSKYHRKYKVKK